MLIAPDGRLVASSDPADQDRLDQVLDLPGLDLARSGKLAANSRYSQRMSGEVVDVFAPVFSNEQKIIGFVRLSHRYNTIIEEFLRARYWILGVMAVALFAGVLLGFWIVVTISRPLQRVTQAVYDLARGQRKEELVVQGPDEIRQVLRAVNFWVESLRSMEQSRRQLLANLVHELGRPIGAIHAALQALRRGSKQDPMVLDELLEGMVEETSRLNQLIDDLSHLHDQVLGTLELDIQTIHASEWLVRLVSPWQAAAIESKLKWQEEIPLDLPDFQGDPLRLGQAIANLIANAQKYTPAGGEVSFSAGADDQEIWVMVSDTGLGISLDEQEKIFLPFFRGAQAGRIPQGMGLGLSIAQDLVEAHGGRIEVISAPGQGSQFTITLPIHQKPPE